MSERFDVSIPIHSAIPNNKGGSGRKRKKNSLYERSLNVWITSKASLTSLPIVSHPQLYEVLTTQLFSIIDHCKVSKALTPAQTTDINKKLADHLKGWVQYFPSPAPLSIHHSYSQGKEILGMQCRLWIYARTHNREQSCQLLLANLFLWPTEPPTGAPGTKSSLFSHKWKKKCYFVLNLVTFSPTAAFSQNWLWGNQNQSSSHISEVPWNPPPWQPNSSHYWPSRQKIDVLDLTRGSAEQGRQGVISTHHFLAYISFLELILYHTVSTGTGNFLIPPFFTQAKCSCREYI